MGCVCKQFLLIFYSHVDEIQNFLNSVLILVNILTFGNLGGLRIGLTKSNMSLETPKQL